MAINYELLNKGGISLGTNFELLSEKPLDSRLVVPSLEGLQNYIDNAAAYEGLIAYVSSEKKHYEVKVIDGVLSYRPFGLTEAELNDLITNATTAAMEFKGATATLPENPAKGDMYKVAGENINIKIDDVDAQLGDSIVYDGTKWFLIPSGDDIEDTWRPVEGVNNDATLKFVDGDKTVAAVAADGTIKYNHATVATPVDVTAEGDEKTRTYITAVETDGYGHITGYKTATENVEDTNTEYTFESQVESSSVYFNVTPNTEGATEQTVYVDAYSKNEVNTELAKKLDKGVYEAYIAGKEMSDADLKKYADDQDAALKAELIGGAEGETFESDTIHGAKLAASYEANQALVSAKGYADGLKTQIEQGIATADYVKKADAPGYGDILTKTDAGNTYAKITDLHSHSNKAVLDAITDTDIQAWNNKVDKVTGKSLVADDEIARLANVDNYDDEEVRGLIGDNAQAIEDLEGYVGTFTHATAKTVVEYINAKTDGIATSGNLEALGTRVTAVEGDVATIKGDYLKAADIADFETKENVKKVADDLAAYIGSNDKALADETKARTDADAGFETRIAALEGNFGDVEAQIAAAVKVEEDARKEAVQGVQDDVDALAEYVGTFTPSDGGEKTIVELIAARESAAITSANTYTNEKIEALGTMAYETATDYVKKTDADNTYATMGQVVDFVGCSAESEFPTVMSRVDDKDSKTLQSAKDYVDGKFTDANLAQYTTEQEVKDIVDGVIASVADSDTYNSLTKLVDYIDAHGGEAADMAEAIETLEGDVKGLKEAPSAGIKASDITAWNGEIGAKALAETKLDASTFTEYSNAHASDYTNKQIDDAIDADVKVVADDLKAHADKTDIHHTHANASVLSGITSVKVSAWDAAEQNAKNYADGLAGNYATAAQGAKADTAVQTFNNMSTDYISINGSPIASVSVTDKVKNGIAAAETAIQSVRVMNPTSDFVSISVDEGVVDTGASKTNPAIIATASMKLQTAVGLAETAVQPDDLTSLIDSMTWGSF